MPPTKPLLISIPHSGEKVPKEAYWLHSLPNRILMYDVDRFVDKLYQPILNTLKIPHIITPWHRYMVDCNRGLSDIDSQSVQGAKPHPPQPIGLHWRTTTAGFTLIKKPLTKKLSNQIIDKYYKPFFNDIDNIYNNFLKNGAKKIYHLDLHSMPSQGTQVHRDPGKKRSDIVICTIDGTTAQKNWTTQVIAAYQSQGLSVSVNMPYKGGTVVQKYGQPKKNQQAIMVEVNRKLYMNEQSKLYLPDKASVLQKKLSHAIKDIWQNVPDS